MEESMENPQWSETRSAISQQSQSWNLPKWNEINIPVICTSMLTTAKIWNPPRWARTDDWKLNVVYMVAMKFCHVQNRGNWKWLCIVKQTNPQKTHIHWSWSVIIHTAQNQYWHFVVCLLFTAFVYTLEGQVFLLLFCFVFFFTCCLNSLPNGLLGLLLRSELKVFHCNILFFKERRVCG